MINNKLTPNELAKLELWEMAAAAFNDGVNGTISAGDNVTEREEAETYRHLHKHVEAMKKQLGMDKIFAKLGV